MATLYGPEWQDQLAMAGSPPEECSEEGERSEGSMGTAPEEALVEEARAATGAEQATDLVPVGPASAASSTVGGESVFQDLSLQRLQETLAKDFVPGAESPARYGKRLRRIAEALALYGEEVEEATVEQRIIRALYLDKIHGKEGPQQLAMLKEFFQELVLLEPPEDQEQEHEMRVNILLGMIQDKGGQLSKSAQKLFSSEENTPEKPRVKKTTVEQTATGRKSLMERNPADEGRGKDRSRDPRRNRSKETLELDHL